MSETSNSPAEVKPVESNDQSMNEIVSNNVNNQLVDGDNSTTFKSDPIPNKENGMISEKELDSIRNSYENKLRQQQLESTRKENILIMRLTLKEQELQDCLHLIETLKSSNRTNQMESLYLDPALNYLFEKMKKEVDMAKKRVEEMQNDMNAWKFNSDSVSGKQLMAKCRLLHDENEELGKMISSGKIAQLESGLAMHKKYSETLNKSQADAEEVLNEIEENVEGYQNTVYFLQQQLKQLKENYENLEKIIENCDDCKKKLENIGKSESNTIDNNDDNIEDNSDQTSMMIN